MWQCDKFAASQIMAPMYMNSNVDKTACMGMLL